VNRIVRELLATNLYQRSNTMGVHVGRPQVGPHHPYDHAGRRGHHGKRPDDDAA
jgi:hypothetical protein